MNIINTRHYNEFKSIISRKNTRLSTKLAKILSYIINDLGIDNEKYFVTGSYALKDYYYYRDIDNLNINMAPREFNKLGIFELGQYYNDKNVQKWILDLKEFYEEINNENINNFYIEIIEIPVNKGYPNNKFSLQSLKNCNLLVDKYNNYFLTIPAFYEWRKIINKKKDNEDIKFIEDNNLLKKEKVQCGGSNPIYLKYLKYKNKYIRLKKQSKYY